MAWNAYSKKCGGQCPPYEPHSIAGWGRMRGNDIEII
jgi:hypothetical protein